jgi:hypothetical protein
MTRLWLVLLTDFLVLADISHQFDALISFHFFFLYYRFQFSSSI